jgi:hypothetical protein
MKPGSSLRKNWKGLDPANENGHENLDYIPGTSGHYIKSDPLGNW